jgi:hypothetical protein
MEDTVKPLSSKVRQGEDCRADPEYRRTATDIRPDPVSNPSSSFSDIMIQKPLAGFSGAEHVWREPTIGGKCGEAWLPIKIVYKGSEFGKILILTQNVNKLPNPVRKGVCLNDRDGPFYPDLGNQFVDEIIDLKNGKTLIATDDQGLYGQGYPELLLISRLPQKVWSSGGGVFVIPVSVLLPELEKAGNAPDDRHRALLSIIGRAGLSRKQ